MRKTSTLLSGRPWGHQEVRRWWWCPVARCKSEKNRRCTPAVLLFSKLFEDHGYTFQWISGQQQHLIKNGQEDWLQHCQLCTIFGSWFVREFFFNLILTWFNHFFIGHSIACQEVQRKSRTRTECASTSEGVRWDPVQEASGTENKNDIFKSEKVQRNISHELPGYLQELRELDWWKCFNRVLGETQSKEVETLPSHLMIFQWGGEQKWKWVRVRTVCKFWYLFEDEKEQGLLAEDVKIWWLNETEDHKVLREENESRNNHLYEPWWDMIWKRSGCNLTLVKKNFPDDPEEIYAVRGADVETKSHLYWHFLDLGKSCEELSWNHCTSTPYRSEANGVVERAIRRMKAGTFAVLLQSSLGNEWWVDSVECYCHLRNIKTSCLVGRHHMKGGSGCRLTEQYFRLERKSCREWFSGMHCMREGIWIGDVMVADNEEWIGGNGRIRTPRQKAQCKGSV